MYTRKDLEQPRTPAEMEALISLIAENRDEYPDSDVHLRKGIHKQIAEEYAPLLGLAKSLPDVATAHLTGKSNAGPDAYLNYPGGSSTGVQITCAGEDYGTSLQREILSQGKPVFSTQHHSRNKTSKEVETKGRILTTRKANTDSLVRNAIEKIEKKETNYRQGSCYLLVSIRQSEITVDSDWPTRVIEQLPKTKPSNYERIYLATGKRCVRCM